MSLKLRLGNRVAPVRFLVFLAILIVGSAILMPSIGWRHGAMASFDVAAVIFLISLKPVI